MASTKEKDEIMTDVNAAVPSKSKKSICAHRCWNGIDTKNGFGEQGHDWRREGTRACRTMCFRGTRQRLLLLPPLKVAHEKGRVSVCVRMY